MNNLTTLAQEELAEVLSMWAEAPFGEGVKQPLHRGHISDTLISDIYTMVHNSSKITVVKMIAMR